MGILLDTQNNLVIRNSAQGNTTNCIDNTGGNSIGPIVTSATIASSSNPHANYVH